MRSTTTPPPFHSPRRISQRLPDPHRKVCRPESISITFLPLSEFTQMPATKSAKVDGMSHPTFISASKQQDHFTDILLTLLKGESRYHGKLNWCGGFLLFQFPHFYPTHDLQMSQFARRELDSANHNLLTFHIATFL